MAEHRITLPLNPQTALQRTSLSAFRQMLQQEGMFRRWSVKALLFGRGILLFLHPRHRELPQRCCLCPWAVWQQTSLAVALLGKVLGFVLHSALGWHSPGSWRGHTVTGISVGFPSSNIPYKSWLLRTGSAALPEPETSEYPRTAPEHLWDLEYDRSSWRPYLGLKGNKGSHFHSSSTSWFHYPLVVIAVVPCRQASRILLKKQNISIISQSIYIYSTSTNFCLS